MAPYEIILSHFYILIYCTSLVISRTVNLPDLVSKVFLYLPDRAAPESTGALPRF